MKIGSGKAEKTTRNFGLFGMALTILLLANACTEETASPSLSSGYEYFPLKVGQSWTYEVDSLIFLPGTAGNRVDSVRSFLKNTIVESFVGNAGDTIFRVEQFHRRSSSAPWQIAQVFSMQRTPNHAIVTENNLPLLKLVFPLERPGDWSSLAFMDPNVVITVAGQTLKPFDFWGARAEIENLNEPLRLGNLQFSKIATATYVERDDIVTVYRFAKEIYAEGVGLVQKDWQILDNNACFTVECQQLPWRERAERGFIVSQRLIEYE